MQFEVTVNSEGKHTAKGEKTVVYKVTRNDKVRGYYEYEAMGGDWDDKKFYTKNELIGLPKSELQ